VSVTSLLCFYTSPESSFALNLQLFKDHHAVDWHPCRTNANFSCSLLEVPKDYLDHSVGVAHIALLKVPGSAPKSEHLGSIVSSPAPSESRSSDPLTVVATNPQLVNPGGPGGSGVSMAERFGPALTKLTDGESSRLALLPLHLDFVG
jgi:hypothetical protein